MKKKQIGIIIIIIVLLLVAIYLFMPKGNTLESREYLLKNSQAGVSVWKIDNEIKLYDYIISSVYGEREGLAVFKSVGLGNYKLEHINYTEKGKVARTEIIHNGDVYYFAWCNQPNLDYAEVIYTTEQEELEPRIFDVKEKSFITFKSPSDDVGMRITYYDKDGNHYV